VGGWVRWVGWVDVGGGGRTATTCAGKLVQLVFRSARPVQLFNATTY